MPAGRIESLKRRQARRRQGRYDDRPVSQSQSRLIAVCEKRGLGWTCQTVVVPKRAWKRHGKDVSVAARVRADAVAQPDWTVVTEKELYEESAASGTALLAAIDAELAEDEAQRVHVPFVVPEDAAATVAPWERQHGETSRAYPAFCHVRDQKIHSAAAAWRTHKRECEHVVRPAGATPTSYAKTLAQAALAPPSFAKAGSPAASTAPPTAKTV